MKIKPEHYAHMLAEMRAVQSAKPEATREYYTKNGIGKDSAKRHRWDLFWAAKLGPWSCEFLYSYANDVHIDTALRSIVAEMEKSE